MNNIEVAILTKVNEIAARYELKPSDIVATIQNDNVYSVLSIEVGPSNPAKEDSPGDARPVPVTRTSVQQALSRFFKLWEAIGLSEDGILRATDEQIIDALDNALRLAPQPRLRS